MKALLALNVILALLTKSVCAQVLQPDYGFVFPQNEVAVVKITVNPDTLALLLELGQQGSEHEFPATFRFESSGLTQTIQNVGFRLRGNTSLNAAKKSFKISFNTFIQGARWQGLEKINLNGSHNDPTRLRTKLCWDMLRKAELPAARTSMVNLYINDQNMGLYTHVEHIDETFTERVFNTPFPGNLYKCLYPADLNYISANASDYTFELNGRRAYELKTNTYADNYNDLATFISILNQTPIEDLPCQLEPVFKVDQYLKQAAFDVLAGNWDGYIFNKNNYYLYKNPNTGQFEFIHYDLDNTLGIDWVNQDWTERSIYSWASGSQQRPLYKRLLQVPEYRNRFSFHLNELMQDVFHTDSLRIEINQLQELVAPVVAQDPFHGLDYGFTFDDFYHGDSIAWGNQVAFAILPYVAARKASALSELENFTTPEPHIQSSSIRHDLPFSDTIIFFASSPTASTSSLYLEYGFSANDFSSIIEVFDDGIAPDTLANDGIYTVQLSQSWNTPRLYYRWRISGQNETFPCSGDFVHLSAAQVGLLFNEAMSDNNGVILDDQDIPSDWIELWNGGFSGVNLTGYYLTDQPQNPFKFELEPGFITPGQFKMLWADNNPLINRSHCSFSLNNNGEELRMYRMEDGRPRVCDWVQIPPLETGISYGRAQDGASNWIEFGAPTPNQSNQSTGMANKDMIMVYAFPIPADTYVQFSTPLNNVSLFDISGREVYAADAISSLNTSNLPEGIYFIKCLQGQQRIIVLH
ncbi:MAG: CotH kinase family protein [Bacteroidia bacterium]